MVKSEQRTEEAFEYSARGVELIVAITMRLLCKQINEEDTSDTDGRLRTSLDRRSNGALP